MSNLNENDNVNNVNVSTEEEEEESLLMNTEDTSRLHATSGTGTGTGMISRSSVTTTYSAGEDTDNLAERARFFGIENTRIPLGQIREIDDTDDGTNIMNTDSNNYNNNDNDNEKDPSHSKNILKFGVTVWKNVGLIFSDPTLEAARMHSVGVLSQDEHVAGDGTLHLMSIVRRKKGTKTTYKHLMDIFEKQPLATLDYKEVEIAVEGSASTSATVTTTTETEHLIEEGVDSEYEHVMVDSVEGGSITAAIFGIIKGMVGPAVLYLPRGFALAGYAVAIPAMIIATMTYLYCATRLLQCWKVESEKNLKLAQQMEKIRNLLYPAGATGAGDQETQRTTTGPNSNEVTTATATATTTTATNNNNNSNHYGSIMTPTKLTPPSTPKTSSTKPQVIYDDHGMPITRPPGTSGTLLTYPEIARRAFGPYAFLISGGIAAMQFGVCLTYLIFVPQNLYTLIQNVFGVIVPKQLILMGMLLIEIPLCWIRDIRKLTTTNILATIFIAFGLISVLYIALYDSLNPNPTGTGTTGDFGGDFGNMTTSAVLVEEVEHLPPIMNTWFLFIGTSFFCFEGSITLLVPLQEAVYKPKDRQRFTQVNRKVTSSIVMFYMIFATICWASFGNNVQTALTASLPQGTLSTLVQFAYSVAVIFTFPLQAFPALEVVCNTTSTKIGGRSRQRQQKSKLNDQQKQDLLIIKRNITASAIICFLGFIAVMATDYLGNVVSLLGSLVGIPIALVYPPLMHNKLVKDSTVWTKSMNVMLSVIGFCAAGAASFTTISSWNEGAEG